MIVVTGATGQLGRLVVEQLLDHVPADQVAVVVRDAGKADDLAARGIEVRSADYNASDSLSTALRAGERVLLVSGSEMGQRLQQHTAVVEAAKAADIALLAYTSILGGEAADFMLAAEHQGTERVIRDSGLPYTFLRNGWYTENYTGQLPVYLDHGVIAAAVNGGRVASASRADFAAAAVAVLTGEGHENRAYELNGDIAWSFEELAAEISAQSGKTVTYEPKSPAQLRAILMGTGLPEPVADVLVDVDVAIARGRLARKSDDLARLIGRPTTPLTDTLREALAALDAEVLP